MQSDTELCGLLHYYAIQWKEGRGNKKKYSKIVEIVFHSEIKKIVYQKVGCEFMQLFGIS